MGGHWRQKAGSDRTCQMLAGTRHTSTLVLSKQLLKCSLHGTTPELHVDKAKDTKK